MQLVVAVLNSLGLVGLAWFLWFIWKGLKERISALTVLANEQGRTLTAVRERADEFDRLSKGYKQALADFEEMGSKLETRRTKLVHELEEAVKVRDERIVQLTQAEIKKVDEQRESAAKIPVLALQIEELRRQMEQQAAILAASDPLGDLRPRLTLSASVLAAIESTKPFPKASDELNRTIAEITRNVAEATASGRP